MTPKSKAFGLSFGFHSLMALLALFALGFHPRPTEPPVSTVQTMVLSLKTYETPTSRPLPPSAPAQSEPEPLPPKPILPKEVVRTPSPLPVRPHERAVPPPTPVASAAPAHEETAALTPPPLAAAAKPLSVPPAAAAAVAPKESPKPDLSALKKEFYTSLRAQIQRHLRYPPTARRRSMEGDVCVRFILESGGTIRDVTVRKGEEVFHDAARVAVASASGVKVPEALASHFPSEIDLTLEFRLN